MPIRIFIGSGDASRLECRTLIHSLRTHARGTLDITVFNGTTCTIERNDRIVAADPSLARLTARGFATEFSLFRYTIPELCGGLGRGLYLDSDMVCLDDIGELFHLSLDGCDLAARPDAYPHDGPNRWATSAMVMDCARVRFDLSAILDDIGQGLYTYREFSQLAPRFLARHRYLVQPIAPSWNAFDHRTSDTKLIHYTDLETQPWKYPYHPEGDVWFHYFDEAIAHGLLTQRDVDEAIRRGHARPDILKGNKGRDATVDRAAGALRRGRRTARDFIGRTARAAGWAR